MTAKFRYDDLVRVRADAKPDVRPNERAWVVGVYETRRGKFREEFPEGVVYTIEFEDGMSTEVHGSMLVHP